MDVSSKLRRASAAMGALLAFAAVEGRALAAPCSSLPTPIYGIGGSAPKPLLGKLATALAKANPPETLIYQAPGACLGPNTIINGTKMTGTASYWDTNGKEQSCDLPITGQDADLGVGNNYATLCQGITALPPDVGDFLGPIDSFVFLVPKASSQTSISAAAAYFVYGFGTSGQAAPWTDETEIIKRDANSAAAILISLAINVPVTKLKGVDAKTNGGTVTLVSSAVDPEKAIGFASSSVAEANAASVNVLAFQAYNQSCGYWPSSTPTSFDKINVRNGHYPIWGPVHFFAKVDANNVPTSPGAKKIIGYFKGTEAPPAGVDVDAITVSAGNVLDCAMEVKRTSDLGDYQSYAPAEPCGCYFEAKATGATSCQACTQNSDCAANAPHCRKGYCEVN
jgi:ABC-type phosphate transport system substrate-binding protein